MLNLFQHPVDKKWLNGWILKQAEGTVRDMCSGWQKNNSWGFV